jgi:hypothetical protein
MESEVEGKKQEMGADEVAEAIKQALNTADSE